MAPVCSNFAEVSDWCGQVSDPVPDLLVASLAPVGSLPAVITGLLLDCYMAHAQVTGY